MSKPFPRGILEGSGYKALGGQPGEDGFGLDLRGCLTVAPVHFGGQGDRGTGGQGDRGTGGAAA